MHQNPKKPSSLRNLGKKTLWPRPLDFIMKFGIKKKKNYNYCITFNWKETKSKTWLNDDLIIYLLLI